MKVHLRQRKQTKNGSVSLYLEIYKGTTSTIEGKTVPIRKYEYLDLYLIDNPKTPFDKQHNKDTLSLAESIKAKRELEIKNGQYGFKNDVKMGADFIEYFKVQMEKRKKSLGNYGNWGSCLVHIINYTGGKLLFKEIDESYCNDFLDYLTYRAKTKSNKNLSSASSSSYFCKFRACLKQAVKDKIIFSNPCIDIEIHRIVENKREYLTFEELKRLAKTDCRYNVLKRAFLFSCLTGLRWSDIQKLKWSEVQKTDIGNRITFHQQKTKGLQYLDISDQARNYLEEEGQPDERVFMGLKYSSYTNVELTKWMLKAGITKNITFHCARHTFAVLQLSLGTEIYTLSKLLGHAEIKTTQIYANIIDEKKREAVNRIPDINI